MKSDYLPLLANRLAMPAMAFIALFVFSRIFSETDVAEYLIAYTITQWALAATYQWQKNAYAKTFGDVNESSNIIVFFTTSSVMILTVFLFSPIESTSTNAAIAGYALFMGAAYVYGIAFRMRGNRGLYLYGDTISSIAKWAISIAVATITLKIHIFFPLICILSIPLLLVYLSLTPHKTKVTQERPSNADLKKILKFSLYMFLFDFCATSINYIDRFYVSEEIKPSYLITSVIGTQISSILLGALISTINPNLKLKSQSELARSFAKKIKPFATLSIAIIPLSYFFGPFAVWIITNYDASAELITLFTFHQILHFTLVIR